MILLAIALQAYAPLPQPTANSSAAPSASAGLIACLNRETAKVAPITSEPAAELADVVIARCGSPDPTQKTLMDILPIRTMVIDRIVRWRGGDKSPMRDPLARR